MPAGSHGSFWGSMLVIVLLVLGVAYLVIRPLWLAPQVCSQGDVRNTQAALQSLSAYRWARLHLARPNHPADRQGVQALQRARALYLDARTDAYTARAFCEEAQVRAGRQTLYSMARISVHLEGVGLTKREGFEGGACLALVEMNPTESRRPEEIRSVIAACKARLRPHG